MQSDKASKKIRKNASEPVAASSVEVTTNAEKTAKPRVSKSSQPKSDSMESTSAKRHRKAATVNIPEPAPAVAAPKTMAAAAGSATSKSTATAASEPLSASTSKPVVSPQRVQQLAYEYWVAEGRPHGNHHEHWLRAERELGLIS